MPYSPKEYQALLEGGCPWCGEELVIRKGKYGEFIACAEWCGYTKSVPGRSQYPPPKVKRPVCPYNLCDGSGLLPLIKEDGKIIPHTFVYCSCKEDDREHYQSPMPIDYDFPMSDTFRGYSYQYCGVPDPAYVPPQLDLTDIEAQPKDGGSVKL